MESKPMEIAEKNNSFDEIFSILTKMKCMTLQKKSIKRSKKFNRARFFIRGTRVSVLILEKFSFSNFFSQQSSNPYQLLKIYITWEVKDKKTNKINQIKFDDLFNLDFLGCKAKTELLFYINFFKKNY